MGDPIFGGDDITDRSEKFLATEIVREKLFRFVGDELPYTSTIVMESLSKKVICAASLLPSWSIGMV